MEVIKKQEAFDKKKIKALKKMGNNYRKIKFAPMKFLDPFQFYRLHGDFVFTERILTVNDSKESIYSFELYQNFKVLRQIHARPHGVVFEFDDFDENEIFSTPFLQERLRSLGNRKAYDFANFIDTYAESFKQPSKSCLPQKVFNYEKIFSWIDDLFEKNQEDVVFIRGNKVLNGKDSRTRFLCYNSTLISWISNRKNLFDEELMRDLLRIFSYTNFEEFFNTMLICMGQKPQNLKFFKKFLNTVAGPLEIDIDLKFNFMAEENLQFYHFFYYKKDHDQNFIQKLQDTKKELFERENRVLCSNHHYYYGLSELIKAYYLKKKR